MSRRSRLKERTDKADKVSYIVLIGVVIIVSIIVTHEQHDRLKERAN
jgi:hypothetical protein